MLREQATIDSFTEFVKAAELRLQCALVPLLGLEPAREATAEALAYGWEHWDRLRNMENPAGYLYRVARTKGHRIRRLRPLLPQVASSEMPWVEPGLPKALAKLSSKQRTVVWLIHGLEWQQNEVADLLGITPATVQTHADRGMAKLRSALGGTSES